jgi:hypothetical protein
MRIEKAFEYGGYNILIDLDELNKDCYFIATEDNEPVWEFEGEIFRTIGSAIARIDEQRGFEESGRLKDFDA